MLCQQHWWLVPSSFFTISLFWGSLFKSPWLTFPFWRVLEGWPLIFLFPRLLDSTFSDPPFNYFPFCHFSQMDWFLSIKLKDSQLSSFIVHFPGFPEVLDPYSWVIGSQVFWSFFASLGGWWDISTLVLRVSGHAPLNCLSPNLALLHIQRIPGS